jgi:hypothetical protein
MRINPILNFNIQSTSKDKQYRNNSHYLSLKKPCHKDVFFKRSKNENKTTPMTEATNIGKIFMKNDFNYTANELHKYLQSEVKEFNEFWIEAKKQIKKEEENTNY